MSSIKADLRTVDARPALEENLCRSCSEEREAGGYGVAEVLWEE